MQPATPPQTPQKADRRSTDNDMQRELEKLSESLDYANRQLTRFGAIVMAHQQSEPRPYRSADASTSTAASSFRPSHGSTSKSANAAEYSASFWGRQAFSAENFRNMKVVFRDVMIYGPGRKIRGVRKRPVSDLALRADDPPTVLCFGRPDHLGEITMKPIFPRVMREVPKRTRSKKKRSKEWDLWQEVEERLLNQWPDQVVSSFFCRTGHFDHDLSFLRDTYFTYHETTFARGCPELVFWKRLGERGFTEFPDSSHKRARISGRAWLVVSFDFF
ncbi:hypothetical protein CLIM01_10654 [Colletotrichum limetticola]|uniref:Uncharacterized protein n=1 Tax=Colletotrichum limetticola TaxID=1209924 RepID=A0ABQ9PK86_9PEZI|nr:hypothetical protein CLIM01_10654 [Colletotrichum limetticola]